MLRPKTYVLNKNINSTGLWKSSKSLLSKLDIELTERCNNNCVHCYINRPANDKAAAAKELSTEKVKTILSEAARLGCFTVRFTGGEPLIRDDFEELYIFARKLGLKVMIFTNACFITSHFAELFTEVPPLEKLEVTFYGMNQESYDSATRNPGSFEMAKRGIELLIKNNIPFIFKSALLPSNKDDMKEFEKWCETIPWMDNKEPGFSMFFDLRARRDSKERNTQIQNIRITPEEGLQVLTANKERYLKGMKEFCGKFTRPPGDLLFSCGAGCKDGCVDAYGNLQLCLPLRHPDTVYDIKNNPIRKGLLEFFPKVRKMRAQNPEYLVRCAKCFLKGLCEQCPAKSWMEHGTLDTPVKYLCDIAHKQGEFLGLLDIGEKSWTVENWQKRIDSFVNKVI